MHHLMISFIESVQHRQQSNLLHHEDPHKEPLERTSLVFLTIFQLLGCVRWQRNLCESGNYLQYYQGKSEHQQEYFYPL